MLQESAKYTFNIIYSQYGIGALSGQSSIDITTNSRPTPGEFAINPTSGSPLVTVFKFQAGNWIDEDLPISYSFYFQDTSSSSIMTLSMKSERSVFSSHLPPGSSVDGSLVCGARIYDIFDAVALTTATVEMNTLTSSNEYLQGVKSYLSSQTKTATTVVVDTIRSAIALTSAASKVVNCSTVSKSFCDSLQRNTCKMTDHSCGPCLEGYSGENGDKNTKCFLYSATRRKLSSSYTSDVIGNYCSTDDECTPHICNMSSGACQMVPKSCINSCSNHGTCTFVTSSGYDILSNVSTCAIDDESCAAKCLCDFGYLGTHVRTQKMESKNGKK